MASANLAMATTLFLTFAALVHADSIATIHGESAATAGRQPPRDPGEPFEEPEDDEAADVAIIDSEEPSKPVSFGARTENEAATRASLERSSRMDTERTEQTSRKTKKVQGGSELRSFGKASSMPYPDLEVFGRADTAAELTRASIAESNKMIDQIERAEVAETKRSVYRSLTRLRGAATAAFDGVARSQVGNIDQYAADHRYLDENTIKHLAKEEADTEKWAFPHEVDLLKVKATSDTDILDIIDAEGHKGKHEASLMAHAPSGNSFWGNFATKEAEAKALDAAHGHASWRMVSELLTGSD